MASPEDGEACFFTMFAHPPVFSIFVVSVVVAVVEEEEGLAICLDFVTPTGSHPRRVAGCAFPADDPAVVPTVFEASSPYVALNALLKDPPPRRLGDKSSDSSSDSSESSSAASAQLVLPLLRVGVSCCDVLLGMVTVGGVVEPEVPAEEEPASPTVLTIELTMSLTASLVAVEEEEEDDDEEGEASFFLFLLFFFDLSLFFDTGAGLTFSCTGTLAVFFTVAAQLKGALDVLTAVVSMSEGGEEGSFFERGRVGVVLLEDRVAEGSSFLAVLLWSMVESVEFMEFIEVVGAVTFLWSFDDTGFFLTALVEALQGEGAALFLELPGPPNVGKAAVEVKLGALAGGTKVAFPLWLVEVEAAFLLLFLFFFLLATAVEVEVEEGFNSLWSPRGTRPMPERGLDAANSFTLMWVAGLNSLIPEPLPVPPLLPPVVPSSFCFFLCLRGFPPPDI